MKQQLALLVQVNDLTPILAVRSLFHWEGDFESAGYSPALVARGTPDDPEGLRGIYVDGASAPSVTARVSGDNIALNVIGAVPPELELVLAAFGFGRGRSALSMQGDAENLSERILTLDAAWILLRRLKQFATGQGAAADIAARIIDLALRWHRLRIDLTNLGSNVKREAMERELLAEANSRWGLSADVLPTIHFKPDPRGSALDLVFQGYHPLSIAPLLMDWVAGSPGFAGTSIADSTPRDSGAPSRYAVRPSKVADDVRAVLAGITCSGNHCRINRTLTPRLYGQVNEVLVSLGGHWNTTHQVHTFGDDPAPLIAAAVASGTVFRDTDYEFFETQPAQIDLVVEKARLSPGMLVLEPQAGRGALALAAAAIVGKAQVHVHELMPRNVIALKAHGFRIDAPRDFLDVAPVAVYQAVVMNPPFSGGRDIAHVMHASKFLLPGGRLVAIMSTSWATRDTKGNLEFRRFLDRLEAEVVDIPRGAFKAVGTDVPTKLVAVTMPHLRETPEVQTVAQKDELQEQLAFF